MAGIDGIMSRDRFVTIKAHVRFAMRSDAPHVSKSDGRYDRLFKIRPLLDKLTAVCAALYRLGRWLTIDEMLVFTKCEWLCVWLKRDVSLNLCAAAKVSYSVRMPNKPIRDGIKIFALCCAVTGCVLDVVNAT